jgi:acyl-CoA thioesterase
MSIGVNLFREQTPEDERRHNRISGGQVTAQALTAADKPAVLSNSAPPRRPTSPPAPGSSR